MVFTPQLVLGMILIWSWEGFFTRGLFVGGCVFDPIVIYFVFFCLFFFVYAGCQRIAARTLTALISDFPPYGGVVRSLRSLFV